MTDFKEVYAVHQGDNDKSIGYPKWFFDNKKKAEMVAKNRGWYGSNAPVSTHKIIKGANGKYYLIAKESPIELNVGPDNPKE